MSPARAAAVEVLLAPPGLVPARLDRALARGTLVAEDRALLAEIVLGTLRMRRRLEHALAPLLARPLERLSPRVRAILESAAYQILFLSRVPAYAAVNEAAHLARHGGRAATVGFVNAVLRRLASRPGEVALPDPAADPVRALAVRHSYPDWIARRTLAEIGAEEADAFLACGNRAPAATLRANRLRGGRDALLARLAAEGIAAEPCRHAPDGVRLLERAFLPGLDVLRDGLASVQDESAILVAEIVAPAPGETVVDLCAAPGGKALAIAERGLAGLRVVAIDRPARVARLRENVARLGLVPIARRADGREEGSAAGRVAGGRAPRVELLAGDARALDPIPADAVLVDAPCSGLGVLRRHADLRWTKRESDVARLAALQGALLDAAARWVRPGGRLVYATCTILGAENEDVVRAFLERHPRFALEPLPESIAEFTAAGFFRTWPQRHDMDGAFACCLRSAR